MRRRGGDCFPQAAAVSGFSVRAGFTLAELAVVLVLIGVVLSVVLPRFGGLQDEERLRTATRRLTGLALEAHSQAVTEARPFFLCLDLDLSRSWLSTVRPGPIGDAGRESRIFSLPRGVVIQDSIHSSRGLVKAGRVSFAYWPQGGSEPGAIHVQNADKERMTIFLRPYLGRTEIASGYLREETR